MLARLSRIGNAVGADIPRPRRYMTCARPVRAFGVASRAVREPIMTGAARSSEGLDLRRRKLLFRSWHRGMREMDLIMGRFADATVQQLTQEELAEFEQLMEGPDRELLAWFGGAAAVRADQDGAVRRRLTESVGWGEGECRRCRALPPSSSSLAARSRWQASPTAPKASLSPISPARWRRAPTRRRRPWWSPAVTARAWPRSPAHSIFLHRMSPCRSFRLGTACTMTGSRRTRASSRSA